MQRVGAIKAQDAADAERAHLALTLSERLRACVELSQAVLALRPAGAVDDVVDDEGLKRIQRHCRRLLEAGRGT